MKGKILGIAVIVVAMGVLVNALALTSASVKNNAVSVPVVATGSALVALTAPTTPDVDLTYGLDAGNQFMMTVKTGLQADSNYTFDPAFKITNNSGSATKISLPASVTTGGVTVYFYQAGTSTPLTTPVSVTTSQDIKMVIDVPAGTAANPGLSFKFDVTGSK